MAYSRRSRFADGKSLLHRVEFAHEFETRLADATRPDAGDAAHDTRGARTLGPDSDSKAGASAETLGTPVVGVETDGHRHVPLDDPEGVDDAQQEDRDAAAGGAGDRGRTSRRHML